MPFMGKDWRSPGEAWVKTETLGWQRMKIIESQLHPGCHQSPACSWPPKTEYGSHMANHCRAKGAHCNREQFRDSNSAGSSGEDSNYSNSNSNSSDSDSSRDSSQSPSPSSSPEKINQQQHMNDHLHHHHHHHLHPITISSPYGKYSGHIMCAHNIDSTGSSQQQSCYSKKDNNNSHLGNAQCQLKPRSLSKESVYNASVNSTTSSSSKSELNLKMRYNNSVADFRTSPMTNNGAEFCFNNINSNLESSTTSQKQLNLTNTNNKPTDMSARPILMKNGEKINNDEVYDNVEYRELSAHSCKQTRSMESLSDNNCFIKQNIINNNNNNIVVVDDKNSCCCSLANNSGRPCNFKQPYVRTAPHCRISVRTREVAMYNTISEAFYRLDFCNAIHDIRRFNYICKLLHLLITQNLTSLSGCATKVLFTMLEQVAWEVSNNKRNIHVLKNLLDELKNMIKKYYCWGRPIGSSLLWQQHFDTIERISSIVDGIELSPPKSKKSNQLTFNDLPVEMIREILLRLNDYRDLINSAQASPVMRTMIDGQYIWRQLCKYHFTEQQLRFAIEHNNLFTKRGNNVRGLKYARTSSADGKTSFRNPVICHNKNKSTTKEQLELTKGRRGGGRAALDLEQQQQKSKSNNQPASSYVTKAIKIFDKQGCSTTLGSAKIKTTTTTPEYNNRSLQAAREKENNNDNNNSKNHHHHHNHQLYGKSQQKVSQESGSASTSASNTSANVTSNEIDWERVFHQLRKHCRCLFWKSFGHPCIKGNDDDDNENDNENDSSLLLSDSAQNHSAPNHHLSAHNQASPILSSRNCHNAAGAPSTLSSNNQNNDTSSDHHLISFPSSASVIGPSCVQGGSAGAQQNNPRPSVAILSRNFDNRAQGNDISLPSNAALNNQIIAHSYNNNNNNNSRPASSAANVASHNSPQPSGGGILVERNARRALGERNGNGNLNQNNNNINNARHNQDELVPKHVAISPQAFLKFFSL